MAFYISLGIGTLGFLPLFIILWKRKRVKKLKQTGGLVTGVVEQVIPRIGYKGHTYYQAVIQYRTFSGRTLRGSYIYTCSGKKPLYLPRQSVEIYYDKDKPEKFIPKNAGEYTTGLVCTIVFAVGYIVVAYCLYNTIIDTVGI